MHVTLVHVRVDPDHLDEFVAASLTNQAASTQEPGALRFDLLRAPDDPTRDTVKRKVSPCSDPATPP